MASPTDRKNQQVWDALEIGAFKQALQLCNKRLKKGEKSDYLLTLKAHTLTLLATPAALSEALQILQQLSTQTPPVESIEALRLLSRTWNNLGSAHAEEISKLMERAVKYRPSDENLAKEWFWGTVRSLDWRGAQKAAMSLQKGFPGRREYWFWAVISCLLLHNSLPENAPDKKLFGMLAYKMISKSVSDTPADTTVIPPRAIQTSQEINLFLELLPYVSPSAATTESLKLLNSGNLGVDSKIGSGDWWGLVRKRLDLLEESKNFQGVFDATATLLEGQKQEDAEEKENGDGEKETNGESSCGHGCSHDHQEEEPKPRTDDWRVWDGFVTSAGELYHQSIKEPGIKALETILAHRASATDANSRNADLALVKFASLFYDKENGPEGTPMLLEACKEYFVKTGEKSCCFEDLERYLQMLDEGQQKEFLMYIGGIVDGLEESDEKSKIAKTASQINYQKFTYLLTFSSLPTTIPSDITSKLNLFITASLKIYIASLTLGSNLLATDNQYGDDAALLSVMGLIRLSLLHPSRSLDAQAPLYQAIIILETLLTKSKHNYQALLLLVRLYLLIGAVDKAVEIWPRLNVKQIQNDTLSHFMLTRISTFLPGDHRVEALLRDARKIYDSSKTQTPSMVVLAFERGGYAQTMGFLEFAERVAGSMCKGMWEIERRRSARLSTHNHQHQHDIAEVEVPEKVWDNRDFGVVVSCEAGREKGSKRFEELFRIGATPGEGWLRAFAAVEDAVGFLLGQTTEWRSVGERVGSILEREEFTEAEKGFLTAFRLIAEIIDAVVVKDAEKATQGLNEVLEFFRSRSLASLVATLELTPEAPLINWAFSHTANLLLDLTGLVSLITSYVSSAKTIKPLPSKTLLADIAKAIKQLKEEVTSKVKCVREELDKEDGALQGIVDRVLREEEGDVGKVLGLEGVFGGVERVAEGVGKVWKVVGRF
ncbi:mitochondrial distribution and morphology [Rhizina undulata]